MAVTRSRLGMNVRGGSTVWMREIYPTPSDTFVDMGILEKFVVNDEHNMVEGIDAAGLLQDAETGGQRVLLSIILKQSDKDLIDFMRVAAGRYYDLYYPVLGTNSKWQEWSVPLVKIRPGVGELTFAAATPRVITIPAYALPPKAAFTRTPTAFNCVVNQQYYLSEQTSAVGKPTDTASALATAIL